MTQEIKKPHTSCLVTTHGADFIVELKPGETLASKAMKVVTARQTKLSFMKLYVWSRLELDYVEVWIDPNEIVGVLPNIKDPRDKINGDKGPSGSGFQELLAAVQSAFPEADNDNGDSH